MKKILVLSEAYPSHNDLYKMAYVHSRNIEYLKQGHIVDVLSFSAKEPYTFEGVKVFTIKNEPDFSYYDAVLSHAPNIRNHFKTIKLNSKDINNLCLFFHGHEILYLNKYYPKPYFWQKESTLIEYKLRDLYDFLKTKLIKSLITRDNVKSIFVSDWMFQEGAKCLGLEKSSLKNSTVINNAINSSFYDARYDFNSSAKKADFITIRPLDGKKYAVDKVIELARNNPKFTFHIYGRGDFFKHVVKPDNVTVFNNFIKQKDIPSLLNNYRAAIMPTRLDAQGVMMCEMACYGIPVILSDLPVCREMLNEFNNCIFINNDSFNDTNIDLLNLQALDTFKITKKFAPEILAKKELEFIFRQ